MRIWLDRWIGQWPICLTPLALLMLSTVLALRYLYGVVCSTSRSSSLVSTCRRHSIPAEPSAAPYQPKSRATKASLLGTLTVVGHPETAGAKRRDCNSLLECQRANSSSSVPPSSRASSCLPPLCGSRCSTAVALLQSPRRESPSLMASMPRTSKPGVTGLLLQPQTHTSRSVGTLFAYRQVRTKRSASWTDQAAGCHWTPVCRIWGTGTPLPTITLLAVTTGARHHGGCRLESWAEDAYPTQWRRVTAQTESRLELCPPRTAVAPQRRSDSSESSHHCLWEGANQKCLGASTATTLSSTVRVRTSSATPMTGQLGTVVPTRLSLVYGRCSRHRCARTSASGCWFGSCRPTWRISKIRANSLSVHSKSRWTLRGVPRQVSGRTNCLRRRSTGCRATSCRRKSSYSSWRTVFCHRFSRTRPSTWVQGRSGSICRRSSSYRWVSSRESCSSKRLPIRRTGLNAMASTAVRITRGLLRRSGWGLVKHRRIRSVGAMTAYSRRSASSSTSCTRLRCWRTSLSLRKSGALLHASSIACSACSCLMTLPRQRSLSLALPSLISMVGFPCSRLTAGRGHSCWDQQIRTSAKRSSCRTRCSPTRPRLGKTPRSGSPSPSVWRRDWQESQR